MKVLFLNPEQYLDWEDEPSNFELRLPMLKCGAVSDHRDYIFQRILRSEGRHAMNMKLLYEVQEYRPDLVVYSTTWDNESIDGFVLREIMARGIPVYTHVWDTHIDHRPHEMEWFDNCTYFGLADSATNYFHFKQLAKSRPQIKGVMFCAGNIVYTENLHPQKLPKEYDLTILGSNEGYRAELIRDLREILTPHGVSVNKSGGLVDSSRGLPSNCLSDNWVDWAAYAKIINQSKICLSSQTSRERNQLKGKVLHYMACGVMCMSDKNTEVTQVVPDKCIVYYDGAADAAEKVLYYLQHEEEREKIAQAGYEWFKGNCDSTRYWSQFLRFVQGKERELPRPALLTETSAPTRHSSVVSEHVSQLFV